MELSASVPLLAGALSVSGFFRAEAVKRPLRSARALLRLPDGMARWRKIAGWLGFDPSQSFVNLLRQTVRNREWSRQDYETLRRAWADPLARKRLCHATQVDIGVITALAMAVELGVLERLPASLFDAAFVRGGWDNVATALASAVNAWRVMRPGRALPLWRTPEEMESEREALRMEAIRLYRVEGGPGSGPPEPFPPPPFPDGPGITPLVSAEALQAEADFMGHCLANGTWEREARRRLGYGYSVQIHGERATLWIRREASAPERFVPVDLRGPANHAPSQPVIELVVRWLAQHRLLITDAGGSSALPDPWCRPIEVPVHPNVPPEIEALMGDEDIPF